MFKLIKNILEAKTLSAENEVLRERAMSAVLTEAQDLVTEKPDAGGFVRVSQITDREKGHLESNQLDMVRQARKMFRWNENARAAIETLVHYVMGRGVSITPKLKNPKIWYVWKEFWTSPRNQMRLKQFEIPRRIFRDGEVFIEFFDKDENGKSTGKTTIRFLDPLLIKNPVTNIGTRYEYDATNTKNGVETDSEDTEIVLRYWVQSRKNENEFRAVYAKNVVHIKIFADSDQKRGESLIQPIMRMITHHEQWLENRILLNKMRTAIVMIKKIEGTPSQVAALKDTFKGANTGRAGDDKKANIRGGTVLVAGPGVDYKMESPNINATDAKEDGRHLKTSMAAGTNLPEYVFGDASNANYSSSMVAEAPMVKAIQFWQVLLEFYWGEVYRRVIQAAVDVGFLEAPDDKEFMQKLEAEAALNEQEEQNEDVQADGNQVVADDKDEEEQDVDLLSTGKLEIPSEAFFGCDMQWPEIVHRDIKIQTESLIAARSQGWVSDPTASAALGYDYAEEVRKQKMVEEDAQESGNSLMGVKPGDDGQEANMEKELDSILKNMTPEERQAALQQRDPQELVKMLLTKNGGNGNANGQIE